MRRTAVLAALVLTIGCGSGQDQETADTSMQETMAPAATDLSAFAGTWAMQAMNEAGDSVLTTYELTAAANMEGWTVTFPDRDPIPAHIVEAVGDSVVLHVGPYPSALRDDVSVTTMTVSHLMDGKMMGYFTATYDMEGPGNILRGRHSGERIR